MTSTTSRTGAPRSSAALGAPSRLIDVAAPRARTADRGHAVGGDAGTAASAPSGPLQWPGRGTEQLLTISEAAAALNVPRTWLRDKVTARQVPHTRLDRHVRFTTVHLAQIVAAGEQQAQPAAAGWVDRRRRRA